MTHSRLTAVWTHEKGKLTRGMLDQLVMMIDGKPYSWLAVRELSNDVLISALRVDGPLTIEDVTVPSDAAVAVTAMPERSPAPPDAA